MDQNSNYIPWSLFCGKEKNSTFLTPNSVCYIDGLSFLTYTSLSMILVTQILFLRGSLNRVTSLPHLRYPGHEIRWIICALLILFQISSLVEGILTDIRFGFLQWHLSLPEAASVVMVTLALRLSTVIERIHKGNWFLLLIIVWTISGILEFARVTSFVTAFRLDFTLLRLNTMLLSAGSCFLLAIVDICTLVKIKSVTELRLNREKLVSDIQMGNINYFQRYSTLLSQCTLSWLYGLLQSSRKDSLTVDKIGNLPNAMGAKIAHDEMKTLFRKEQSSAIDSGRPLSLKRVLVWFCIADVLFSGFLQLLSEICSYAQPLGVKGIIQWVTRVSPSYECMIYKRLLSLSSHLIGSGEVTVGEVTNHLAQDTFCLEQFIMQVHSSWTTPLRIAVSMFLLYRELGSASAVAMAMMFLSIPLQFSLGQLTAKYKSKVMGTRDSRIKRSGEMLQSIRYLKLSSWEESFCNSIEKIRGEELKGLSKMQTVFIGRKLLASAVPIIVSAMVFALYSYLSGKPLTPDSAFFALTIIQQTQLPLTNFSLFFESLASTTVSVNRLAAFFKHSQINKTNKQATLNTLNAIELLGGNFTWGSETNQVILHNINIQIPKGKLTMIIGPVGSGKSSLLSAMLGEMTSVTGSVRFYHKLPQIAYSAQKAWILNASLQKNITLGDDLKSDRYFKTLRASALEPDIAILPAGDQTEIGEKGVNISGGQQQRVSIARTLYSERDIILMDDPLSALDVHVGRHVFQEGIMKTLCNQGKTVVLVTHQIQYINDADQVILMDKGRVKFSGTPSQLQLEEPYVISVLENSRSITKEMQIKPSSNVKSSERGGRKMKSDISQRRNNCKVADGEKARLIKPEERKRGRIAWSVYVYYIMKCGLILVGTVVSTRVIDASLILTSQFWLSNWSESTTRYEPDEDPTEYYVIGFIILSGFGVISSGFATTAVVYTAYTASRRLHKTVLRNISRLPLRFFDVTPVGRILNRLSQDTMQLDELMVRWVEGFISTSTAVLITLITNVIIFPPICLSFLPLGFIFHRILLIFLGPARDLKRFESVHRSPYLSLASETVNGVESIRAYRVERDLFNKFCKQVDKHYVVNLYSRLASVWVTLRLAYLAAAISACISVCVVVASLFLRLEPSLVGLAIAVSLSLPNDLQRWMQVFAQLEIGMNAVERQKYYSEMKSENYEGKEPPFYWLCEGSINIQDITVKYDEYLEPALRNVSFTIKAGQKIGICGRTGSGKSTLILCLLRMLTPENGRILIDDIDIATIPLATLRRRIAIIPQDPTLFSGTVRNCLDMENKSNDEEIWRALDLTKMKDKIVSLKDGLDSVIDFGGSNFSLGEKQLLCLARAVIRNSQIIIMDEATASIDIETDDTVRKLVGKLFQNKTVITVAHRLSSIMDADVIIVLSNGAIAESGSSVTLLSKQNSIFSSMVRDGK
ncbi:ATP-binding cassette sub-family C member 9-like isoform X2 [Apostichopus japonicus]|uniref:ATP-binding cassette sub-family C member 9-like isoform X2 n=1 Tax=Stichopus japonicus TaxID=307972 RepID=UPI003AB8236B